MTAGEGAADGPAVDGTDGGTDAPAGRLARIAVFPVKSLDPEYVERTTVGAAGALEPDRRFAIVDADGEYVNGKREQQVHRLRSEFDLESETLAIRVGEDGSTDRRERFDFDGGRQRFDLDADRAALADRLSEYFGYPVELRRDDDGGYPDDERAHGPTVISTATLKVVASWFPALSVESVRRRFRANLEVAGVPAFWEDRLYGPEGEAVRFRVGDVAFRGMGPCQRCVVPTRDPWTGEATAGFRETFLARREATLPAWAEPSRFDHYYKLMVNTDVPEGEWGGEVAVGDAVEFVEG